MEKIYEVALENIEITTVIICLCVGFLIKSWNKVPNKFIPTILAVLGIAFSIWAAGVVNPGVVLKGILSGVAATGLYELVKQYLCEKFGVCSIERDEHSERE